jgi:hypothetical protein
LSIVTGLELERHRLRQPADVVVVADGDERLQVDLERHVARERVGAARGHADDVAIELAVDVVGDAVAGDVLVLDPLRHVVAVGDAGADGHLHLRLGLIVEEEVVVPVVAAFAVAIEMRIGAEADALARVGADERIDEPRAELDDRRAAAGVEIVIGVA